MHNSQVLVYYSNVDILRPKLFYKNGKCTIITPFSFFQFLQVSLHNTHVIVSSSDVKIIRFEVF